MDNWEAVQAAFLERFTTEISDEYMLENLRKLPQTKEETVRAFYDRVKLQERTWAITVGADDVAS